MSVKAQKLIYDIILLFNSFKKILIIQTNRNTKSPHQCMKRHKSISSCVWRDSKEKHVPNMSSYMFWWLGRKSTTLGNELCVQQLGYFKLNRDYRALNSIFSFSNYTVQRVIYHCWARRPLSSCRGRTRA